MERKSSEKIEEKLFECPYCSCRFATRRDLDSHFQAWSNNEVEHIRQLDRVDRSFRRTLARDREKNYKNF